MITPKRIKNCLKLLKRSGYHYYRAAMIVPPYWLSANGQLCRVAAGSEAGAGSCYSEVAVEDCYRIFAYARRARPRVIVDIGANLGVFSKLCSMLFPEADIYAYEPHPSPLDWLRQNATGTRIHIMPVAVGETSGVVKLDTNCDSTNSSVKDDGDLPVPCVAASEVADGRPIDLLKMDCEGSEWSILRDPSLLGRTREFCLAYHLIDGHTSEELQALIARSVHRIVRWHDTDKGEKYGLIHSILENVSNSY
ncbi:MAG: FkbM family methyltransferase [Pyrinomonadaceae bacterium]